MWQNLMVGVIVMLAGIYCIWYVLPVPMREAMGHLHPALGPQQACSTCNNCGACAQGKPMPDGTDASSDFKPVKFYSKSKT